MTVADIIRHAQLVAEFASKFDEDHAERIITITDEPGMLLAPGDPVPRYYPAAIDAARLICFDASAQYRDGKPRHYVPESARC